MKIPIKINLIERCARRRLRRIMRGYRFLKDSKSLNLIDDVKLALTMRSLDIKRKNFSTYIFGEGIGSAEIVCRQYLLSRLAGLTLNRALLYALGKSGSSLGYYIPPEWRKTIRNQGIKVAPLRTALLWNAFVGVMMAYGILRIAKIIFKGIKASSNQSVQHLGSYVYFDELTRGNLPQPCRDGRSHDIITWYMQCNVRVSDIDTICHGVPDDEHREVNGTPVVPVPDPILPLARFSSIVRFAFWGLGAILIASWDYLRGRWWHALLLGQAALAAQVRMLPSDSLARVYLFHNSNRVYRPLWTYEAEVLGSAIVLCFYSTNCEPLNREAHCPPPPYGYGSMSWPHYLVWDQYQADFVRRAVNDRSAKIDVVGQIWFRCSTIEIPKLKKNAVAVFDVTPRRQSVYCTLGADWEFYVPSVSISFLKHCANAINQFDAVMLWKMKRKNLFFTTHPHYLDFVAKLGEHVDIVDIDPDISALRVIESSYAVISMPFTSTALIAKELGKPSVYFDPSGQLQRDDRAAHGIEIIRGPEELSNWLKSIPVEPFIS